MPIGDDVSALACEDCGARAALRFNAASRSSGYSDPYGCVLGPGMSIKGRSVTAQFFGQPLPTSAATAARAAAAARIGTNWVGRIRLCRTSRAYRTRICTG